jgi:subtilisin family serine protease
VNVAHLTPLIRIGSRLHGHACPHREDNYMRRPAIIGGLALTLVAGSVIPAQAETAPRPKVQSAKGRFDRLDLHSVGKISNLPAMLQRDAYVNALVELTTAPVAAQEAATGGAADGVAVQAKVSAEQASKDAALRAAGATVEGRLTQVLNAVRVRVKVSDLTKVAAIPGVRAVQVSRTVQVANGAASSYTGATQAWQDLKLTGAGTVIGVIDTGIDYTHADFGGPGTVAAFEAARAVATQVPNGSVFPTTKILGGWDFVGDAYNAADPNNNVPAPDPNPIPCGDHGTHVAGTAAGAGVTADGKTFAGPYNGTTLAGKFLVAPGSAPEAKLRGYKVFGCDGSVDSDVIVAAIDRAVADKVNVINMSLGSTYGTGTDLDAKAVNTATAAGVLVVASAGNSGPNAYLTGSPGTADTALAVAAMDASAPTFPAAALAIPGGGTIKALNANAATIGTISADVMLAGGAGSLGCAAEDYAGASGKIVITYRGVCARVDRAVLGQKAGAVAVIMINSASGLPPFEGPIDGVTIPFLGVDAGDAAAVQSLAAAASLTITANGTIVNPGYGKYADFTSAGPRRLDDALKPDIAAPGVSIVSAAMGKGTGSLAMSGTSMASPHTAGLAALVRQAHPGWTPAQVKAALMSTADPSKVGDFAANGGPTRGGTGLVQPRKAADTVAYAWTPDGRHNLSFGLESMTGAETQEKVFKIANTSRKAITYDLTTQLATSSYGATVAISPKTLTVPPRTSRNVTVTIKLSAAAVAGLPAAAVSGDGALVKLSGAIVATPRGTGAGIYPLRTGFLLVPRGLSDVKAHAGTLPRKAATPTGKLSLTNAGVHSGTAEVFAWTQTDPEKDVANPEVPDIVDVGVQTLPGSVVGVPDTDRLLVFAVNSHRGTSTHATQELDVLIDTTGDGKGDYVTFVTDYGAYTAGDPDGSLAVFTIDIRDPENMVLVDLWAAFAPANTSIEELPVLASSIGLTEGKGSFTFTAASYTLLEGNDEDSTGVATFDAFRPALSSGNAVEIAPKGKATVPLSVDKAQLAKQPAKGWLVVTGDDRSGRPSADRVALRLG